MAERKLKDLLDRIANRIIGTEQRIEVWTNPDPSAAYTGNFVEEMDLSDGDTVEVMFYNTAGGDGASGAQRELYQKCRIGAASMIIGSTGIKGVGTRYRYFTVYENGISFGTGFYNDASTYANENNKHCVPVKVWLLKNHRGGVLLKLHSLLFARGCIV